ncbi:MAG TPA: TlpA disulfide reductase family protein, partial [Chitinophagaceae bacterium]|nr:TlpA disulfide reductase family protein [Chitinophagaceae bacterium]
MKSYYTAGLFTALMTILIFQSCAQPNTETKIAAASVNGPAADKIVLIFEKTNNGPGTLKGVYKLDPEKARAMRLMEALRNNSIDFTILNQFNDEENFLVNNFAKNDTFTLDAKEPKAIFVNAYPGQLTYLFKPGDTAVFSYMATNAIPSYAKNIYAYPQELVYCTVKNRETAKQDQSYILFKRALDGIYFFEPDEKKFELHNAALDSMKKDGSLSDDYYNLYRNTLRYEYLSRFQQKKDLFNKYFTADDLSKDDMVQTQAYRMFLKNYVSQAVMQGKTIKISGGISIDFKNAYDSIRRKFNGGVRDYLLISAVKGIKSLEKPNIYQSYVSRLEKDINNDSFTNYFNTTYSTEPVVASNKTVLTTIGNTKTLDLSEVLAKEKGKVVYVDLWASWCIPCRASMPASEKLRNDFSGKVSFVYLSIDQKYVAWEIASRAEKLLDYTNSYLLKEPKGAALVKS